MKSNDHQKEGHKVHLTPVRPICAHLSRTGGNQEALTMGCAGDSVAGSWCPTSVTWAARKQSTCCPAASTSSWPITSRSFKCYWCATHVAALRLLTASSPRPTKPLWKGQPSCPLESQSQRQTVQLRKWIDSSFAHFVCVNKTVKLRQNNNKQNKTKNSAAVFYSISGPNTYGVELSGSVQAEAGSSSAHQWNSYTGFGNKAVWMPLNLAAHFWKPCHSC